MFIGPFGKAPLGLKCFWLVCLDFFLDSSATGANIGPVDPSADKMTGYLLFNPQR